jgi:hypothetical protein
VCGFCNVCVFAAFVVCGCSGKCILYSKVLLKLTEVFLALTEVFPCFSSVVKQMPG